MDKPKYDIGQELYAVTQKQRQCPICENVYVDKWLVDEEVLVIEEYKVFDIEGDKHELYLTKKLMIPPRSINTHYFTTRQAAQHECNRRNREGGEHNGKY